jgi:HEAT repeat protein
MSPLTIALVGVGSLVLLNLVTAVTVRVTVMYRKLRESNARARMRMREGVALFAVEATDDLPRALTGFERRLLRETLLEIAHELTGSAFDRLVARFAERGFITEAERLLRSRLLLRRVRGAEIIGELGDLDSVPALRRGLSDREPLVRFACAHALTRVGAEGLLDEVLAALSEGETVFSQGALAEVLLDSGPDSVSELRTLLGDLRHPRRRRLIVVVLGELRAFEAVPELVAALGDPDDELRARACHALGKIGDPESAEALAAVAIDGELPWFVRTAAAGACGQIGDPRTADSLVKVLHSDEWYPRNAAAAALVQLGDAGLAAACSRVGSLHPESVAHYWGLLDAAGRTEEIIARATRGERRVRRFVAAAARAGATARLEELAARGTQVGRYAAGVLRPPARDTRSGRYTKRSLAPPEPVRDAAVVA